MVGATLAFLDQHPNTQILSGDETICYTWKRTIYMYGTHSARIAWYFGPRHGLRCTPTRSRYAFERTNICTWPNPAAERNAIFNRKARSAATVHGVPPQASLHGTSPRSWPRKSFCAQITHAPAKIHARVEEPCEKSAAGEQGSGAGLGGEALLYSVELLPRSKADLRVRIQVVPHRVVHLQGVWGCVHPTPRETHTTPRETHTGSESENLQGTRNC